MPRKSTRGTLRKIIIELDIDEPGQLIIWQHWQKLAETGNASNWVRLTLESALSITYDAMRRQTYSRNHPEYESIGTFENKPRPPAPANPLKAQKR
jgi:hypothetical protein